MSIDFSLPQNYNLIAAHITRISARPNMTILHSTIYTTHQSKVPLFREGPQDGSSWSALTFCGGANNTVGFLLAWPQGWHRPNENVGFRKCCLTNGLNVWRLLPSVPALPGLTSVLL